MLVSKILDNDILGFNEEVNSRIQELLARKLVEMKQQVAFSVYALDESIDDDYELVEDEDLDEAAATGTKLSASGKRWKVVRARVRKGQIQRNKRVTNTAGYTFRNSTKSHELVRMSPVERRNRKRGQKIGKIKRKAKMSQARLKRKRSDRRRKAIGL